MKTELMIPSFTKHFTQFLPLISEDCCHHPHSKQQPDVESVTVFDVITKSHSLGNKLHFLISPFPLE